MLPPSAAPGSGSANSLFTTVAAILGVFTALGAAIDALLLTRRKKALYGRMEEWWVELADTRIPEIHQRAALITTRMAARIVGRHLWSFRSVLSIVVASYAWTLLSFLIGFWIGLDRTLARQHRGRPSVWEILRVWEGGLTYEPRAAAYSLLILPAINIVFDGATIWSAAITMRRLQRAGATKALGLITISAFAAFGLALYCFWCGVRAAQVMGVSLSSKIVRLSPAAIIRTWQSFFEYAQNGSLSLFAVTTLVPISLFFLTLLFLVVGKLVLEGAKWIAASYLELAVDKPVEKFAPFTLIGVSCGALTSIFKALGELMK